MCQCVCECLRDSWLLLSYIKVTYFILNFIKYNYSCKIAHNFPQNAQISIYHGNGPFIEINLQWEDRGPGSVFCKSYPHESDKHPCTERQTGKGVWRERSGPCLEKKSKKGRYNRSASHTKWACSIMPCIHWQRAWCFLPHALITEDFSSLTPNCRIVLSENTRFALCFENVASFNTWINRCPAWNSNTIWYVKQGRIISS